MIVDEMLDWSELALMFNAYSMWLILNSMWKVITNPVKVIIRFSKMGYTSFLFPFPLDRKGRKNIKEIQTNGFHERKKNILPFFVVFSVFAVTFVIKQASTFEIKFLNLRYGYARTSKLTMLFNCIVFIGWNNKLCFN